MFGVGKAEGKARKKDSNKGKTSLPIIEKAGSERKERKEREWETCRPALGKVSNMALTNGDA